jgi:hypothetical protein
LKNKVTTPDRTIEIRFEKLAELKRKELINDAEYAARREKILDEVSLVVVGRLICLALVASRILCKRPGLYPARFICRNFAGMRLAQF